MSSVSQYIINSGKTKSYKTHTPHWRAFFVSLGSLYFGIMIAYFGALKTYCRTERNYKSIYYDLQGNIMLIGVVCGVVFISKNIVTCLSRSKSLIVGCILGIVGTTIVLIRIIMIANSQEDRTSCQMLSMPDIYVGRFVQGLAVGIFTVFCPLFIYEISPLERKILLGAFFQLGIEIGIIFVDFILTQVKVQRPPFLNDSRNNYLVCSIMCVAILALLILMIYSFVYLKEETPKYLISVGRNQEARSLIESIYKQQYSRQIYLDKQAEHNFEEQISQNSFFQSFDMKEVKTKCLLLGIYAMILQQVSGINFLNMYQYEPKESLGLLEQKSNFQTYKVLFSPCIQIFGTGVFLFFNKYCKIQKMGERKFLIKTGTILIFIIHLLLLIIFILAKFVSTEYTEQIVEIAVYVLIWVFMFVFGATLGPVIWLYTPEIMEPRQLIRSIAWNWSFSICTVIGTIGLQKIGEEGDYLGKIISEGIFVAVLVYYLIQNKKKMLVQTKNKTKLEIIRIVNDIEINSCMVASFKKCS